MGGSDISGIKSASVSIKIIDKAGNPIAGVSLALNNSDKKPVLGFLSDNEGKFPQLSIQDEYISLLRFSMIGYQEIDIKMDELFDFICYIDVILADSDIRYIQKEEVEKFLVKEKSEGRIVMLSIPENRRVVLEKKVE
ncbi:carboxypeptidase-like regulatory domain-containing protein [Reichenbachiella sp. MALMAid0571]|uniref:carboxypeptidase-like regulatory domain-containing protein n=1 Tax=Reichenbachiella sp. MALMAid0571 TaxID=3143939 RepID=UPI0032DFBD1A